VASGAGWPHMSVSAFKGAFDGVKVFSATIVAQRTQLGDVLTEWLAVHRELQLVEIVVKQSSDARFHCLSFAVFYRQRCK
jgi:hypothetical protein